ncbi:MAG: hypothetical protein WB902_00150 [Acetobacteraceae bacterium]|jgi:hypothetical protein
MTWGKLMGTVAAGAVVVTATCNMALAQQVAPEGRVYVFHSRPAGQCPSLDWHVVVGENNTLSGIVAWNNMKNMANVSGTIAPNRSFSMQGKEVGGSGRTATITGVLRSDGWLTANVKGQNLDCQGILVMFAVPPPQGGG